MSSLQVHPGLHIIFCWFLQCLIARIQSRPLLPAAQHAYRKPRRSVPSTARAPDSWALSHAWRLAAVAWRTMPAARQQQAGTGLVAYLNSLAPVRPVNQTIRLAHYYHSADLLKSQVGQPACLQGP